MNAFVTTPGAPVRVAAAHSAFICSRPVRATGITSSPSSSSSSSSSSVRCSLPATLLAANPAWLEAIAKAVGTLNMPAPVVTYGHPAMMGFMVLGMGLPGAVIGWNGRLNEDKRAGVEQKKLHENIMLAFFLLAFLGGTGGTLSTAMQGYDVWQSPHAVSAAVCLALLGANSVISYSGFTIGGGSTPQGRQQGRKLHSYFGIAIMAAFAVHGFLGVQILLQ